eukprot:4254475-Prymnesium_polylepis.1
MDNSHNLCAQLQLDRNVKRKFDELETMNRSLEERLHKMEHDFVELKKQMLENQALQEAHGLSPRDLGLGL